MGALHFGEAQLIDAVPLWHIRSVSLHGSKGSNHAIMAVKGVLWLSTVLMKVVLNVHQMQTVYIHRVSVPNRH
jgi:hypothetical protein